MFVSVASALCLVIGYPVAYFIAKHAGRFKGLFLVLFLAPFWISYMMRMLAWINLLQPNGYVNRILESLGLIDAPIYWLNGKPVTVILGLTYGYVPYMILPLFATLDRIPTSMLEASRDLGAGSVQVFRRVTLPMSRQGILAGLVIVALPMFGDYFTTTLLAGTRNTAMIGNLILTATQSSLVQTGASLVLILLALLIVPMLYYLRARSAPRSCSRREHRRETARDASRRRLPSRRRVAPEPVGKARFLWVVAIAYMAWSLLPVAIAVLFSFNATRSLTSWQGVLDRVVRRQRELGLGRPSASRCARAEPEARDPDRSHRRSPWRHLRTRPRPVARPRLGNGELRDALLIHHAGDRDRRGAVPLLRAARGGDRPGFVAQLMGLSMFMMAYPVIVVRARLLSIGKEYEEAAMDLGASPLESLRRVLLPLLAPAILASVVIVFAASIDNFVISQQLSIGANTQTVPILIYSSARRGPLPSLNALASLTLFASTLLIAIGAVAYRRHTREQRASRPA